MRLCRPCKTHGRRRRSDSSSSFDFTGRHARARARVFPVRTHRPAHIHTWREGARRCRAPGKVPAPARQRACVGCWQARACAGAEAGAREKKTRGAGCCTQGKPQRVTAPTALTRKGWNLRSAKAGWQSGNPPGGRLDWRRAPPASLSGVAARTVRPRGWGAPSQRLGLAQPVHHPARLVVCGWGAGACGGSGRARRWVWPTLTTHGGWGGGGSRLGCSRRRVGGPCGARGGSRRRERLAGAGGLALGGIRGACKASPGRGRPGAPDHPPPPIQPAHGTATATHRSRGRLMCLVWGRACLGASGRRGGAVGGGVPPGRQPPPRAGARGGCPCTQQPCTRGARAWDLWQLAIEEWGGAGARRVLFGSTSGAAAARVTAHGARSTPQALLAEAAGSGLRGRGWLVACKGPWAVV